MTSRPVPDEAGCDLLTLPCLALQLSGNEQEEENVCPGPCGSGTGGAVETINAHALFIPVIAWHKPLHSIDFSLLNELGRGPKLFFRFP